MATFSLGEFLEDDSITLEDIPSRRYKTGHAYTFASPTFEVGLWLKNLIEFGQKAQLGIEVSDADGKKLILDDDEETDVYRRVMGETFEQMRSDGVSWGHTQQVFALLLKKWGSGKDIAVSLQEAVGEAEARPNRAARRAKPTGSAPKGGSSSNRASSATKGRTRAATSTRSGATSTKARAPRAAAG